MKIIIKEIKFMEKTLINGIKSNKGARRVRGLFFKYIHFI